MRSRTTERSGTAGSPTCSTTSERGRSGEQQVVPARRAIGDQPGLKPSREQGRKKRVAGAGHVDHAPALDGLVPAHGPAAVGHGIHEQAAFRAAGQDERRIGRDE